MRRMDVGYHNIPAFSLKSVGIITVFKLLTAHAPISTQSSNLVVFRLQLVYFYLLFFIKHMLWVLI